MLNKVLILKLKANVRKLLWTFFVCPVGRNPMITWLLIQKLKENSRILSKFVRKSQVAFKAVLSKGKSQGTFMDVFGWSEGLLSLIIGRNLMIPWLVIQTKFKENSRIFLTFGRKGQGLLKTFQVVSELFFV